MGILSWLFGSKERSRRSAGSATIWTDDDLNRRKRSADEWQEWEPTQRPPNADGEWAQIIDVHVKGTGHRRDDFDSFVREVKSADTSGKPYAIRVVREPDNPHDQNAIAIHADIGGETRHIGYVPREAAEDISKAFPTEMPLQASLRCLRSKDDSTAAFIWLYRPAARSAWWKANMKNNPSPPKITRR
jgi:hypothetical protein